MKSGGRPKFYGAIVPRPHLIATAGGKIGDDQPILCVFGVIFVEKCRYKYCAITAVLVYDVLTTDLVWLQQATDVFSSDESLDPHSLDVTGNRDIGRQR